MATQAATPRGSSATSRLRLIGWTAGQWRAVLHSVRFATAPAIATPKAMARTAGMLYISGSVLSLTALLLPQMPRVRVAELIVMGVISLAVGIALVVAGHHWPRWCYHLLIFNGNVVIALGIFAAGGGRTSIAYATLYVFVALNCFFFFAWPLASVHLAVAVTCCVLSLWAVGDANFGQMLLLPGTLVVVGVVVGRLVRAADAAEFDQLTGLLNRRGLDRLLSDAVTNAALGTHSLSLVFLDIDHFRAVNQNDGQSSGDRVLRAVAAAWRPLLGEGQVLGRYGGDEFALVFTDASPKVVVAVTALLRAAMPDGHTCSAGIADWEPADTASLLAARADTALYDSKRNGRDRQTYHGNHQVASVEIRRAVREGEIVAFYQPVIDLSTGVVTGFEALARWIRPGHGMVPPDEFIPQAEASGAIEDIGRVMLNAACRQVAVWSKVHGRPLMANVNVCGRELRNPAYVAQVRTTLADAGLPASQLMLELTETAFEGNAEPVVAALKELHALGIRIAIDDFGTGYSSLSRLDRLPVDVVKIDRSFVSPLPADAERAPLVAAITAMARALGLRVVAEGIEHPYQAALMSKLGCDEGQGYWFDRPCPAEQVDLSPRAGVAPPELAAEVEIPVGLRIVG
jgi:diguanylate cyclase (GGDEF)-like protein